MATTKIMETKTMGIVTMVTTTIISNSVFAKGPLNSGPATPNSKRTNDGNFSEKTSIRLEDLASTIKRKSINDSESRKPTVQVTVSKGHLKERLQKATDPVHNDGMSTNVFWRPPSSLSPIRVK